MSGALGHAPVPAWLAPPPRARVDAPLDARCRYGCAVGKSLCGQTEWPPASNRGWLPDLLADHWHEPRGCAWCARFAWYLRWIARTWVPPVDVGSCDSARYHAERAGLWVPAGGDPARVLREAPPLSVVLYTNWVRLAPHAPYAGDPAAPHFDAVHAEVTLPPDLGRLPLVLGGNTSAAGFNANGGGVFVKESDLPRVYGVVLPAAA